MFGIFNYCGDFVYNYLPQKLLNHIYRSRKHAYDAIDRFIKDIKENRKYKKDYNNIIKENIKPEWFMLQDYQKEIEED